MTLQSRQTRAFLLIVALSTAAIAGSGLVALNAEPSSPWVYLPGPAALLAGLVACAYMRGARRVRQLRPPALHRKGTPREPYFAEMTDALVNPVGYARYGGRPTNGRSSRAQMEAEQAAAANHFKGLN